MRARNALARLARHPDGVLVSEETVQTFQLQPGDSLKLRLQSATDHRYHVVPFRYLGMVREFPTAPRDSFLVANAAYLQQTTGADAAEVVLLHAPADTGAVAAAARRLLADRPGLRVMSLGEVRRLNGSSLTAIDLGGLTRLELGFAVLMVAAVTGLVFLLGLAERRRSFAILVALGAKRRQVGTFLCSEAAVMLGVGVPGGVLIGLVVAEMLVKLLGGVFDPPPQSLVLPWAYLGVLLAAGVGSAAAAVGLAGRLALRGDPAALRRD
jgi:putative ABC transport system permease protein